MSARRYIHILTSKIRGNIGSVLFFTLALFLVYSLVSAQNTHAATAPAIITYQGKLQVDGYAATTTLSMKFVLYDSSSGGNALYTASGTLPTTSTVSVTPSSGLFSVNLGDTGTNALSPAIFQENQSVYLEVTVNGQTLSPRKQLTASPYAFNAKYLDGIAGSSASPASAHIPVSDSSGYFEFNRVTIDRGDSADFRLAGSLAEVSGPSDFYIAADGSDLWYNSPWTGHAWLVDGGTEMYLDTNYLYMISNPIKFLGNSSDTINQSTYLSIDHDGTDGVVNSNSGGLNLQIAGQTKVTLDSGGDFGIGNTAPTAKLEVTNGSIMASGTTGSTPGSGPGTRLMWIPEKGAFRAGAVSSTQWDNANIGLNSVAFGANNLVSGPHSIANGRSNTVGFSNDASFATYSGAFGNGNTIRFEHAYIFGSGNTMQNTALGSSQTTAGGFIAGGNNTITVIAPDLALPQYSFINGYSNTIAGQAYASILGYSNRIYGGTGSGGSVAFGMFNHATGTSAMLLGYGNMVSSSYGAAFGYFNTTTGDNAFALGMRNVVSGNKSMAFGASTTVSGNNSIAFGLNGTVNTVSSDNVMAILASAVGVGTTTPGDMLTVGGGSISLDNEQRIRWRKPTSTEYGGSIYLDSNNSIRIEASGVQIDDARLLISNSYLHTTNGIVMNDGIFRSLVADAAGVNGYDFRLDNDFTDADAALAQFRDTNGGVLMRILESGQVLIGTTTHHATPYKLYVHGSASTSPGLGVNGYVQASGYITASATLDLAETYPVSPTCALTNSCPEEGDAVCLVDGAVATIEKCSTPYSAKSLGIVSTNPGVTLGGLATTNTRKIALAGRVPLKVSAANGPIKVGDKLTTSDVAGVAKKATGDGVTIGIALEDYSDPNPGQVLTFVQIGWSLPSLTGAVSANATTTEPTLMGSIVGWLKELGVTIEQNILKVKRLIVDDELCIKNTCITEDQLQTILNNNQLSPSPIPAPKNSGADTTLNTNTSTVSNTTSTEPTLTDSISVITTASSSATNVNQSEQSQSPSLEQGVSLPPSASEPAPEALPTASLPSNSTTPPAESSP